MAKWRIFLVIITIIVFLTPMLSQKDALDQNLKFLHYVGVSENIIYYKSLHWLKSLKKNNKLKLMIISTNNYTIYGEGNILVQRFNLENEYHPPFIIYGTGELIPATFTFSINGQDKNLILEIKSVNIFQHDVIADENVKVHEFNDFKKKIEHIVNMLGEYIIKSEENYSRQFKEEMFNK